MRDFLGNILQIGDDVVYITNTVNDFQRGVILKLNPKTCVVLDRKFSTEHRREYSKVIKINRLLK